MAEEMKKPVAEEITPEKIAPETIRAILQDGVPFEIVANYKTIWHRLGIIPMKRRITVYPITMGALFLISKIMLTMEQIVFDDGEDMLAVGIRNIVQNKDKLLEIVALGIMNQNPSFLRGRCRKWFLVRFLDRNLNSQELLQLVTLTVSQMGVTDFLASTVSIKQMNLMRPKETKAAS